jgi:hypothetical protein
LAVDASTTPGSAGVFAIGAARRPLFMLDLDVHSLAVEALQDLPPGTGWGEVPTPMF